MSFVPGFFDFLITHFQQPERQRMLTSIAVTAAPEHWLSLESAGLLDVNRSSFGLEEALDHRHNVPRWLIAAERHKVDLWVDDQLKKQPSYAIEFKVVHNNKNAFQKIWEIRCDLCKTLPQSNSDIQASRWGIVMMIFHRFYDDQRGGYVYERTFEDFAGMLDAFKKALVDEDEWYQDAPKLELVLEPVLLCDASQANYIDETKGQSAIYMALVRKKLSAQ